MQAKQISTDILDNAQLLTVLVAIKNGDFSVRMPLDRTGVAGKIADTVNEMIDHHERLTSEFRRVSTVVGKEGKTAERAALDGARGVWKDCIESFNLMVDLLQPTAEVARVIGAVAKGNLSQSMSLEIGGRPLTGEFFRTANTINTMVDQLNAFASEVTRVAREVGTEGKLGGQADVQGVAGIWKDLTDSVNFMASNLTGQVRNIAEVTT
ncbi:MAG: HAMP domain-containing protein, partial [Gammaproteobacteria bacterium]